VRANRVQKAPAERWLWQHHWRDGSRIWLASRAYALRLRGDQEQEQVRVTRAQPVHEPEDFAVPVLIGEEDHGGGVFA
jgi:hypothetical protein